jgi:hypothetical protein
LGFSILYLLHQKKPRNFFSCGAQLVRAFSTYVFATSKNTTLKIFFLRSSFGSGVFHLCFCYIKFFFLRSYVFATTKNTKKKSFLRSSFGWGVFDHVFATSKKAPLNIFFLRSSFSSGVFNQFFATSKHHIAKTGANDPQGVRVFFSHTSLCSPPPNTLRSAWSVWPSSFTCAER